jgi:hypothetical protein
MEYVPEPHFVWKERLLAGDIDDDHFTQFGHLLGSIHREGYRRGSELRPLFSDRSFFESLRMEPFYVYTAGTVPEAADFFTGLITETRERSITLVHGDYSPKNILIHNGRLILLDHEVIHFGDPAFDVGFSLAHLLSKANHLTVHRTAIVQATLRYWQAYYEELGDVEWQADLAARSVRHTLGCLLARVKGKSQLEYLSERERSAQLSVSMELIKSPPSTIEDLIGHFVERVETAR